MGEFTIEETANDSKQVPMGRFTVFSPENIDDWHFDAEAERRSQQLAKQRIL